MRTVNRSQIVGICKCGYIELNPASEFERYNGGLVVKRSRVHIIADNGKEVKKFRPRRTEKINRYHTCNACVNDWR